MRSICFYFQVHQPLRLRTYRFFDMGVDHHYYDEYLNRTIMHRVAKKCYIPANEILLKLLKKHKGDFKVSFSLSGIVLEQFERYAPEVLESFKALARTGHVEFLTETYAHSLASLKSRTEFERQVRMHSKKIGDLFGQKPVTFRNTELIYSDDIGEMVYDMGFRTMLTEGARHILGWKSPNYLYQHSVRKDLHLLLKNFRLSDDIAFRFSDKAWSEWPLTAEKYVNWLNKIDKNQELVNIFIDYETFGEHQWEETGILDFLKALPGMILSGTDFSFATPKELVKKHKPVSEVFVPHPISWADEERDVTAWLGNELQDEAFSKLYYIGEKISNCRDEQILHDWIQLQASDHFYYMCTKWFSDGDVHRYFNPYPSPYEAFINYMNVLSDFMIRVEKHCAGETGSGPAKPKTRKQVKRKKPVTAKAGVTSIHDIGQLSSVKIKQLIRGMDPHDLFVLLKGLAKPAREKIEKNMTRTAAKRIEAFADKPVKTAKKEFERIRKNLEEKMKAL